MPKQYSHKLLIKPDYSLNDNKGSGISMHPWWSTYKCEEFPMCLRDALWSNHSAHQPEVLWDAYDHETFVVWTQKYLDASQTAVKNHLIDSLIVKIFQPGD